jgi:hypothetical protein
MLTLVTALGWLFVLGPWSVVHTFVHYFNILYMCMYCLVLPTLWTIMDCRTTHTLHTTSRSVDVDVEVVKHHPPGCWFRDRFRDRFGDKVYPTAQPSSW